VVVVVVVLLLQEWVVEVCHMCEGVWVVWGGGGGATSPIFVGETIYAKFTSPITKLGGGRG